MYQNEIPLPNISKKEKKNIIGIKMVLPVFLFLFYKLSLLPFRFMLNYAH